jgi:hypothetical protein
MASSGGSQSPWKRTKETLPLVGFIGQFISRRIWRREGGREGGRGEGDKTEGHGLKGKKNCKKIRLDARRKKRVEVVGPAFPFLNEQPLPLPTHRDHASPLRARGVRVLDLVPSIAQVRQQLLLGRGAPGQGLPLPLPFPHVVCHVERGRLQVDDGYGRTQDGVWLVHPENELVDGGVGKAELVHVALFSAGC